MATETRVSITVEQPEVDVFSSYVVDRLPNPPVVTLHFTPSVKEMEADGVTQKTNTTGHPLHRGVASGYSISIVCQGAAALSRLQAVMSQAATRIAGGADIDAGLTAEAEELRDAMLADWDAGTYATLPDLEAAYGVKVQGNHPFT